MWLSARARRLRSIWRSIQKSATSKSTLNKTEVGVGRMRDRIRQISRVEPSGHGSSCHTQELSGPPQDHRPRRTERLDRDALPARTHRHDVARGKVLQLRDDPPGAAAAEVVEQDVAIPANPPHAGLHQPGPDLFRWRLDRDPRVALKVGRTTRSSPGRERSTSSGLAPQVSCRGRIHLA
jgi:hypothetical protein